MRGCKWTANVRNERKGHNVMQEVTLNGNGSQVKGEKT